MFLLPRQHLVEWSRVSRRKIFVCPHRLTRQFTTEYHSQFLQSVKDEQAKGIEAAFAGGLEGVEVLESAPSKVGVRKR